MLNYHSGHSTLSNAKLTISNHQENIQNVVYCTWWSKIIPHQSHLMKRYIYIHPTHIYIYIKVNYQTQLVKDSRKLQFENSSIEIPTEIN